VPQKPTALKRKYPNDGCKPLKPLANCCLCRLSCFTFKSLAYERLRQRTGTCRLQYPTSPSTAGPTFAADRVGPWAFAAANGGAERNFRYGQRRR
jgi:hypothetical protein